MYTHMQRIFGTRKRLVIYLEADKLQALKVAAKQVGVSVNEYVRGFLYGVGYSEQKGQFTGIKTESFKEPAAIDEARKKAKSCVHGVKMGFHCWQCGGKAKP